MQARWDRAVSNSELKEYTSKPASSAGELDRMYQACEDLTVEFKDSQNKVLNLEAELSKIMSDFRTHQEEQEVKMKALEDTIAMPVQNPSDQQLIVQSEPSAAAAAAAPTGPAYTVVQAVELGIENARLRSQRDQYMG